MSAKGRQVEFHGAFTHKRDAKAKERRVRGSFVDRVKIKGKIRYLVLTRR